MPRMPYPHSTADLLDDDPQDVLGRAALMAVWGTLWTTLVATLWAAWPAVA